ncbi:hypothetical protein PR048_020521 [Dryococelus australis]|uniref:Uncharacterized protein n=1 Tax=Dryococelus australis TaxID=614101 RepID=A0ABQ9H6H6_9NEOP|nr:hypothetical protein PR048_020521 [Dryococelus australis]
MNCGTVKFVYHSFTNVLCDHHERPERRLSETQTRSTLLSAGVGCYVIERLVTSCSSTNPATFNTDGKVNRHNVRIWGQEHPHETTEHERASSEVNVFCSVPKDTPTVTGIPYLDMLTEWLFPQLEEAAGDFIFQQDGAPPHWHLPGSRIPVRDVAATLDQLVTRLFITGPPRIPVLTPCNFFPMGYQVFRPSYPDNIDDLKTIIMGVIQTVTLDMLTRVWNECKYRVDIVRAARGGHIEQEEGLGKESAMAFVWDPSKHSHPSIPENHGKSKSGWPYQESNPGPPECESTSGALTSGLQAKRQAEWRAHKWPADGKEGGVASAREDAARRAPIDHVAVRMRVARRASRLRARASSPGIPKSSLPPCARVLPPVRVCVRARVVPRPRVSCVIWPREPHRTAQTWPPSQTDRPAMTVRIVCGPVGSKAGASLREQPVNEWQLFPGQLCVFTNSSSLLASPFFATSRTTRPAMTARLVCGPVGSKAGASLREQPVNEWQRFPGQLCVFTNSSSLLASPFFATSGTTRPAMTVRIVCGPVGSKAGASLREQPVNEWQRFPGQLCVFTNSSSLLASPFFATSRTTRPAMTVRIVCGPVGSKAGASLREQPVNEWQRFPGQLCVITNSSSLLASPFFVTFLIMCTVRPSGSLRCATYLQFLQDVLPEYLEEVSTDAREAVWFQQVGDPPHLTTAVRRHLDIHFPDLWIGRGGPIARPPGSPDITPPDLWLWGYIKSMVYATPLDTRDEFITWEIFAHVSRKMRQRCNTCVVWPTVADILNRHLNRGIEQTLSPLPSAQIGCCGLSWRRLGLCAVSSVTLGDEREGGLTFTAQRRGDNVGIFASFDVELVVLLTGFPPLRRDLQTSSDLGGSRHLARERVLKSQGYPCRPVEWCKIEGNGTVLGVWVIFFGTNGDPEPILVYIVGYWMASLPNLVQIRRTNNEEYRGVTTRYSANSSCTCQRNGFTSQVLRPEGRHSLRPSAL